MWQCIACKPSTASTWPPTCQSSLPGDNHKSASSMYRHKKQTGGAGQIAEVHMRLDPQPHGAGYEFASEVFGGTISSSFFPR